jgi:hypothetical protein
MNIPAVILEIADYRKRILDTAPLLPDVKLGQEPAVEASKIIKSLEEPSLDESGSVRERVKRAFEWILETFGYDEFKRTAIRMKKMDSLTLQQYAEAKGELAEVYLYITIREFLKKIRRTDWKVYHHLWVPYVSGKGRTELDVVLVSQYCIIVFECKSFNGRKSLTRECLLTSPSGIPADIYKQNGLHCHALWEQIHPFMIKSIGTMKSVFFNFSVGEVIDSRTEDAKRLIPMIDETTLIGFLKAVTDLTSIGWKQSALDILDEYSLVEYCAEEHIATVTQVIETEEEPKRRVVELPDEDEY